MKIKKINIKRVSDGLSHLKKKFKLIILSRIKKMQQVYSYPYYVPPPTYAHPHYFVPNQPQQQQQQQHHHQQQQHHHQQQQGYFHTAFHPHFYQQPNFIPTPIIPQPTTTSTPIPMPSFPIAETPIDQSPKPLSSADSSSNSEPIIVDEITNQSPSKN